MAQIYTILAGKNDHIPTIDVDNLLFIRISVDKLWRVCGKGASAAISNEFS